jgi:hypothetical protein
LSIKRNCTNSVPFGKPDTLKIGLLTLFGNPEVQSFNPSHVNEILNSFAFAATPEAIKINTAHLAIDFFIIIGSFPLCF